MTADRQEKHSFDWCYTQSATILKKNQSCKNRLAIEFVRQSVKSNSLGLGLLLACLGIFSQSALADEPQRLEFIPRSEQSEPERLRTIEQPSSPTVLPRVESDNPTAPPTRLQPLPREGEQPIVEQSPPAEAPVQVQEPSNQPPVTQETTPENEVIQVENLRGNPVENRHPFLNTAHQLYQGEILTTVRYRQSFPDDDFLSGLTGQPTIGFTWGVTNNLELTFDVQTVDNEGPGRQGNFRAQRTTGTSANNPNFFQELTLQAKQRLWQNERGSQGLSAVVSLSRGSRPYRVFGTNLDSKKTEIVPAIELPFTVSTSDRFQFTLSPKVAFLPEDNALYFRTLPIPNAGSFGTTFGLAAGISYRPTQRLMLWGDAFVPFTGNNTIDRDSGLPARTIAYNAGFRYIINPRLSADLFISNTLGNTGALSIIADKDFPFAGFSINFLPGVTSANRRYATSFRPTQQPPPAIPAGFAFLDGGTIPSGQLLLSGQGRDGGVSGALQYGLMDDLEIGAFIDYIGGTTDESLLGFSGRIRLLHQADGDPFTLSVAGTLARSNNVMINLVSNNPNEFEDRGLRKGGFAFRNERTGELFVYTLSTPIHYEFKGGSAIWMTPTLGFVQRNGLQIAGINFGGSIPITKNLDLIGEAGVEFNGEGNALIGNRRKDIIPWNVGLRWNPFSDDNNTGAQIEAYATNRLGWSPFENLRVQADNPLTFGVGVRLPIQF
jgi:hypothetical protein